MKYDIHPTLEKPLLPAPVALRCRRRRRGCRHAGCDVIMAGVPARSGYSGRARTIFVAVVAALFQLQPSFARLPQDADQDAADYRQDRAGQQLDDDRVNPKVVPEAEEMIDTN